MVASLITIYLNNYSVLESIFLLLSLIGVFITIEIIKVYFQENNVSESKFCSIKEEFSCTETIKSKNYAFSKYIEFVDLPVIYFVSIFFGLIFSIITINSIGLLSTFSLPAIIYSLYIQKKVLKKWCLLCLVISLLLITNSFLYWYFEIGFKIVTIKEIVWMVSILSVWIFIKKLLFNQEENKNKVNILLRFKRNEAVFNAISLDVLDNEELVRISKITIGNTNAPNTLLLFISPSCPHCHAAFKEAYEIIEKYSNDIKLEIAYNLNIDNTENPYLDIAKTTMQLYNQEKDYIQALKDWHLDHLEIEVWKKKWLQAKKILAENEQLEKQFQWCLKNEFNYAPVKIFNGKLVPQHYEINELFYFFKEEN